MSVLYISLYIALQDHVSLMARRRFKWATSVDARPAFDVAHAKPRDSLLDIGWGPSVCAVARSASGSLVFFQHDVIPCE